MGSSPKRCSTDEPERTQAGKHTDLGPNPSCQRRCEPCNGSWQRRCASTDCVRQPGPKEVSTDCVRQPGRKESPNSDRAGGDALGEITMNNLSERSYLLAHLSPNWRKNLFIRQTTVPNFIYSTGCKSRNFLAQNGRYQFPTLLYFNRRPGSEPRLLRAGAQDIPKEQERAIPTK